MIVPRLVLAGFGRRSMELILAALVIAALSAVIAIRLQLSRVPAPRSTDLNERSVRMSSM